jgi:TonB-linked SusC/RagA family outer membrane protein
MKRLTCLFVFFCAFLSVAATAQMVQVKGNVSDSSGAPLQGVSVMVKDTKKGTSTDAKGGFSLAVTAPSGKVTLVFSSTNFKTQTVTTDGKSAVNIILQRDVAQIEDVVVIGYQTVRRKDLLASVSSVGAKELKDVPINSAAEALNGRLAGVTATTSEGSPDAEVRVRVRGGMSITNDNSPLYIVDGVQVENALNTLSPQDIQTIDVLKDAAATAIYGARGANGVVVITTKSGKPGKLRLSYNGFVGIKALANELDVMNPYQFVIYQSERSRQPGASLPNDSTSFATNYGRTWDTLQVYKNVNKVDWQKEVFGRTGFTQTHNLSASGGTNLYTYTLGYTYNDDKAIVINSTYKRHLFNAKGDYKITKKIKLGAGVRYTNQNVWGAGVSSDQGASYNRLRNTIKYRPFLSDGYDIEDTDPFTDPANVGNGLSLVNPIQLANAEYRNKTTNAFNVTATLSYNITKTLSFKSTFGYDVNKVTDRQFYDSVAPYSKQQGGNKPLLQLDTTERKTMTNSNVLTFSLKNLRQKHNIDLLVGEETYDLRSQSQSILFKNFPNFTPHGDAMNNTGLGVVFNNSYPRPIQKSRYTSLSFFSRASYDYRNKYYVSFNVRADGSSKFAPQNHWGYFPSASAAWVISREGFMENVSAVSNLKLRAGFGTVGNNRINDYLFLTTFNNNGTYYYGVNNLLITAYYPKSLVNENLKWESTVSRNIGLDVSFLRRFDLSVDVYSNTSKDLLLDVPIAPTYGYVSQLQNIGKTSNKGFEIQLNAMLMTNRSKNFTWNDNFNISHNENRVVSLGNQQQYFPATSWFSQNPPDYIVKVGSPVGTMYGFVTNGFYTVNDFNYNTTTGVYTLKPGIASDAVVAGTVQPGSLKLADLNGDGFVDVDHDMTIIGDPTPDFFGGLNQQFTYKQWDASIFLNFSVGGDIYNANKIELTNAPANNSNLLQVMEGRWRIVTETGQTAQWVSSGQVFGIPPDQLAALNANANIWMPLGRGATGAAAFIPHSWAIEDGSFLRLNNVTVGYSLPAKKLIRLHMSKLRFYATVNNLAVLTKYTGFDPEVSVRKSGLTPNLDYSAYPKSRSFIFGVNVTF